ncbi:MAG: hypothetical protein H7308_09905 [Chthonomonadaceae bacterium]|nr:hypothetical protein [Chthonomonadaceae bacterium]
MKTSHSVKMILALGLISATLLSGCRKAPEPDAITDEQKQTQKQMRKEKSGE